MNINEPVQNVGARSVMQEVRQRLIDVQLYEYILKGRGEHVHSALIVFPKAKDIKEYIYIFRER